LVEARYDALKSETNAGRLNFWFLESRTPERLIELCSSFPNEAAELVKTLSLLSFAIHRDVSALREGLQAEMLREQVKDRLYWEPLKREREEFRRDGRAAARSDP